MNDFVAEPHVGYALEKPRMTAQEFLDWDETQTVKHEFVRGEVFMMAGGEDRHATVAGNLYIALRLHLRGGPCHVYNADVKLRVEAADCYFYPDVMVTCSVADAADRLIKREPVLVVEVLSPSTAAFDRGDKFADYRQLPSLREYLLVDVQRRRCDLYRVGADGLWVLYPTQDEQALFFASVGLTLPMSDLWSDLEPDAPASDPSSAPSAAV